ncbi:hypothetical protein ACIROD_24425 [Peribacillus sp. NPDC101481]
MVTPFSSDVILEYKGRQVDLKSILGLMSIVLRMERIPKIY